MDLALSLIGYEDEVSAAMEYVFGSIFVCDDPDTAKKVTFDPAVRTKSVTLEGDVYDPAGTLSGGSSAQSSGILLTLQTINELTKQISNLEKQLKTIKHTLAQEKAQIDLARKLRQGLDLKRHEIKLGEEQISNNSSSAVRSTDPSSIPPANHFSLDNTSSRRREGQYRSAPAGDLRCGKSSGECGKGGSKD